MPTPIPSIDASAGAQSGTSITAASPPISALEMPSPNSAVASGSPAATTEPNVSSRTSAAMARPTISEEISPPSAFAITCPPSSIRRPSPPARSASAISRSPVSGGTAPGSSVIGSRRTPIVPSRETSAVAAAGGRPMPSSPAASRARRSMRACTAGSAAAGACHTTSTVSGLLAGKRSWRSCAAARDSEPGVE